MTDSFLQLMTGMDFYHYSCSECETTIVAIRTHKEPIQCSEKCKKKYEEHTLNETQS